MLRPSYLEQLPKPLIELYSDVEMQIIANMAERIAAQNMFIPAVQWQYQKLIEMGNFHSFIVEALANRLGKTRQEVEALMLEAGQKALAVDTAIYRKAGLSPPALATSPVLQQVLKAGSDNTMGLFENLTRTTAQTATKQFEGVLDRTWLNVNSGAFSHTQATRMAIDDLASKGLKAIEYPSGHSDYLDVAVRRATVTGVNQTALKMQETLADELDSDLVEVTAHSGARNQGVGPMNHAAWQGKVYSRSGTSKKYPSLREVTGYGTGEGLGGWNCRHNFFPFFEGMEPTYSKKELEELNAKNIEWNGKKYTEYEATQIQRKFERDLRANKRRFKAQEAAGLDTSESAAAIAQLNEKHRKFLDQTGLKRQYDRERMGGWGVKEAAKARGQAKTYSGKIAEKSKPPTVITQKAIDRVPLVEIPGLSKEQSKYIQSQHKELLQFARDENDNKEVAFIFNRDFSSKAVEKGVSDSLTFSSKESYNLLNNQSNLFVMHNHPGNSSFSDRDIRFFVEKENVSYITVVKNNGGVEILTKADNYDRLILQIEFERLRKKFIRQGTDQEYDKLVYTLLTKTKSGIVWRKL